MSAIKNFFRRLLGSKDKEPTPAIPEAAQHDPTRESDRLIPSAAISEKPQADLSSTADRETFVIGIDFGTAFTKVVVGDGVGIHHWAIPFDQSEPKSYLFPGILSVHHDSVKVDEGDGRAIDDIKLRIIENDIGPETMSAASAYLALILTKTRAFLIDTKIWSPHRAIPEWFINIGLPTDSYRDSDLQDLYIEITAAAWVASFSEDPITLELTQELHNTEKSSWFTLVPEAENHGIPIENIAVFPEFVAQLAGYVRSDQRENGLHLLLDIGSGTVDCSAFNIEERDGEDTFEVLAKSVRLLGVRFLQKARSEYPDTKSWLPKLTADQPDDDDYAASLGIPVDCLKSQDGDFFQRFFCQIGEAMKQTAQGGKVATGPELGVPIFLCGGGSRYYQYDDTLLEFIEIGLDAGAWRLYKKRIDVPGNLSATDLPKIDYDRLSVAYGLSIFPYNLGQVVEAQLKQQPVSPTVNDSWRDNYIDKDQV